LQDTAMGVTAVNDPAAGTDKTITTVEETAYTFAAADFGFTDPADAGSNSGANALLAVEITTLPGSGALEDNNVAVSVGQFIPVADIMANKLVYTPAADQNGNGLASFTFEVQDDGGTANGGVDLDQSPNTITVNATAVNDAPVNTVPGTQEIEANTSAAIAGLSVADVDAANGTITTTLSVAHG